MLQQFSIIGYSFNAGVFLCVNFFFSKLPILYRTGLSPVSAHTICFHFADWQKYFRHKFGLLNGGLMKGELSLPLFPLVWIHYSVLNTKNLIIFQQQMGVLHEGVLPWCQRHEKRITIDFWIFLWRVFYHCSSKTKRIQSNSFGDRVPLIDQQDTVYWHSWKHPTGHSSFQLVRLSTRPHILLDCSQIHGGDIVVPARQAT